MQISKVRFSELNTEKRIDAEYYRAEILSRLDILEKKESSNLNELVDFIVGPFGSTITVDKYVDSSDFRYIRNKDIIDLLINDDDPVLIPEDIYVSFPQYHIKEADLLITVVGTLGKVAIARTKDEKSIFSCKSTLIRPKKINPYYLLTYLNSNTGQLFSLRGKRGAIQEGLNLSDLKGIKVYLPSNIFQKQIENIVKQSFTNLENSILKYSNALRVVLKEINIINWKPTHSISFIKNYSDTQNSDRIDAEYYQPKYDEIINAIKFSKDGWDFLGNLVKIRKSVEPGSSAYCDSGIPFVRVSDLSKFEIAFGNTKYISEELYNLLKTHQPKRDEILLSKDATPGIAFHLHENPPKMIPSGGILRLTIKDKNRINEEYLTLVLNSVIGQQQMLRDSGGSVIYHWRPDQIKNVIIPLVEESIQVEIKSKITESFDNRKKSKLLLEIAKRGVEIAIEQGEKAAQDWMDEQLKINNLSLITNA